MINPTTRFHHPIASHHQVFLVSDSNRRDRLCSHSDLLLAHDAQPLEFAPQRPRCQMALDWLGFP